MKLPFQEAREDTWSFFYVYIQGSLKDQLYIEKKSL